MQQSLGSSRSEARLLFWLDYWFTVGGLTGGPRARTDKVSRFDCAFPMQSIPGRLGDQSRCRSGPDQGCGQSPDGAENPSVLKPSTPVLI